MPDIKYKLVRGGTSGVDSTPLRDGQILFDKEGQRVLLDAYINGILTRIIMTADVFVGATSEADGQVGLVPRPMKGDETKFLKGDGTWAGGAAFSGDYNDLTNKPTLGTASSLDVAASGDASSGQVVKGDDTRLTDARPASDVPSWAKESTKPSYTASEVGLGNVGNFKAVSTVASQGLTDTEKSNARANIGAGTSSFSGSYNDLTNKPTIPTVNNATLTIQKNGTKVNTFTANASSNVTANITVPTKVSELTNDSGYTTNAGTITGIKMNGSSKGTSGVVDLGTVLTAHQSVVVNTTGTASATAVSYQRVGVAGSYTTIQGTMYMLISNTSSASYVFTNSNITADSSIDVYTDTYGDNPSSVSVSGNTCTVTFSEAKTRSVKIYIK